MSAEPWTADRLAAFSIEQVKVLRENAVRLGDDAVALLCNEAIAKRTSTRKVPRGVTPSAPGKGQVVIGFHFVCLGNKCVTINEDDSLWTGTWVVDQRHAEIGSKIGAYVALHTAKSEPSYLQGTIKDWREARREGQAVKIEKGVDFLLERTFQPYQWNGGGSGEKGYLWGKR